LLSLDPHASWPWLAIAALGVFHGINPAMGWLFAVGLGLQRRSRRAMLVALAPLALGHALATGAMVAAALGFGLLFRHEDVARAAGILLIGWAAWHLQRGPHRRPNVGMRTGLAGLVLWSFLMASAHGAGLMLMPVLAPMCRVGTVSAAVGAGAAVGAVGAADAQGTGVSAALQFALLAVALHSAAMFSAIATTAILVYDRFGVAFLRTGWINLDWVWCAALACSGLLLLAMSTP
jgi:hypothetical protein